MMRIASVVAVAGLLTQAASAQVFFETFDNNNAGWTLGNEWQIGPATSSTGHSQGNADPDHDATNTVGGGVAGVVIGGNATTTLHPFYYLTSPVIPLTTGGTYTLEFARFLNSDYTPYMQNIIEAFDGAAWQQVWASGGSPSIFDTAWNQQSYDVSAFANPNFQIRFGHTVGSGGAYTVSSWNIDNVSIIPAPGALALLGLGMGVAARRRR